MKQTDSGLYLPDKYVSEKETNLRGFGEMIATGDPYKYSPFGIVSYTNADETPVLNDKTIEQLKKERKPENLLPILIKSVPLFATAMSLYKENINQGIEIVSEDGRTQDAVDEVKQSLEAHGRPLDTIIEEQIYAMQAEGGISYELNFENGNLIDIAYVSPYTLIFEQPEDDPFKRFRIKQKGKNGQEDKILYDPRDPNTIGENQTFFYRGINKEKGKPRGLSKFLSALRSAVQSLDVDNLFIQHLRGQAFPRGFLSPKIAELVGAEITGDELVSQIKDSVKKLKEQLDKAGPSESVISSIGFDFVLLGALSRANMNGGEIVIDQLLYNMQIALDLPDALLPSRKTGVLGEQSGRTQWRRWQTSLRNSRDNLSSQLEPAFQVAVAQLGIPYNTYPIEAIFDNTDHEGQRMESEALKLEAEGLQILVKNNIIDTGEARAVIAQYDKFTDLDLDKEIDNGLSALPIPEGGTDAESESEPIN